MLTLLKKTASITGSVLLAASVSLPAFASSFNQVYTFGDSISDTGRLHNLLGQLGQQFPASPPYFNGRFSNGPLWIEYFHQGLGITYNQAHNFAFAGATTGDFNVGNLNPSSPPLPGLTHQLNSFNSIFPSGADPNALYVIWAGANDYNFGIADNPLTPVDNISNAVEFLYGLGARQFLIPNLPDLGESPGYINTIFSEPLSQLTLAHNALLSGTLTNLENTLAGIDITPLDVYALVEDAKTNPDRYGFTSIDEGCLPTDITGGVILGDPCTNHDEYIYWDSVHPTARSSREISKLALRALGIPEPSTTLGLIGIGILAVGLKMASNQK